MKEIQLKRWSPAGRIVLIAALAALLAACATAAAERATRVPDSVLTCLSAAERDDLEGFLDSFDFEKADEDRAAYETVYRVWLAGATNLEWEVVRTEPRTGGGQSVAAEVVSTFGIREERTYHLFLTDESGALVYWAIIEDSPAY